MRNWDNYCERYLSIRGSRNYDREAKSIVGQMNSKKSSLKPPDYEWLSKALLDEDRKWFVVFFLREIIRGVPKKLYQEMIQAAIREKDSSRTRYFIELCQKTYGHREVYETLLSYVTDKPNEEKAGAVRALYWAKPKLVYPKGTKDFSFKNATRESKKLFNSLRGMEIRKNCVLLKEFVENDDPDVRRSIIPAIKLKADIYPESVKPLVEKAIEIARTSDDEYLKQRVEVQLSNKKLLKPLKPAKNK